MREIKFRGYSKELKKWVIGQLVDGYFGEARPFIVGKMVEANEEYCNLNSQKNA